MAEVAAAIAAAARAAAAAAVATSAAVAAAAAMSVAGEAMSPNFGKGAAYVQNLGEGNTMEVRVATTIHSLRVGWRNFFSSCAVVSVFCSGWK